MKRRGLILPSVLGLLLAGMVVVHAGVFSPRPSPPPKSLVPAAPDDPSNTEEIQRWRSHQPKHWRACLLQQ